MKPPRAERLTLPGPTGSLEALVEIPSGDAVGAMPGAAPAAFGVVCHPHPLYGGTLDNKVVYTLARAFVECGVPAIRFNFRGVGASAGAYDEGSGETDDALAAIAYGRQRWPGADLWLAGFSFGAAVAVRAAQRASPRKLVAVAPGITPVAMQGVASPRCPWLLVQGDADEVIEPAAVLEWAQQQSFVSAAGAQIRPEIRIIPGGGHFFHGRLQELRQTVVQFLRER